MLQTINQLKLWYEQREIREKLLILALGWAAIYAVFALFVYWPLEKQQTLLITDIKTLELQQQTLLTQIGAVKKIPETPLYKQWLQHDQSRRQLHAKYQFLLKSSPNKQQELVIKTILQSPNSVKLIEVKNSPESSYHASVTLSHLANRIFQKQLSVAVYSQYFDTIQYLQRLEKDLPNIHWDGLEYEVTQYPLAKVKMEFSIIYEKD